MAPPDEIKITFPVKFKWDIDETHFTTWFNCQPSNAPYYESPLFSSIECDDVKFVLLFKFGKKNKKDYQNVSLKLVSSNQESVTISGHIRFTNNLAKRVENKIFEQKDTNEITLIELNLIFSEPDSYKMYSKISPMYCLFQATKTVTHLPICSKVLGINLSSLRKNVNYADVTFKVAGKHLPANKCILAARSSVFKTMFQNVNFEENKKNIVKIGDIAGDIFEGLLEYIYTAKVDNLSGIAPELIQVAHQYDMPELVFLCAGSMVQNFTVENAAEYLHMGVIFEVASLKEEAITFINSNSRAVLRTENWKKLITPNNELMIEVYENMSEKWSIYGGKANAYSF